MQSSSRLTIEVNAIVEAIKKLPLPLMAMVKANGYGLGSVPLARLYLSLGVTHLGISHLSEALHLRAAGIKTPLFLLCALANDAEAIIAHNLQPAICDTETAEVLNKQALAQGKTLDVHLHIDTGLHRFGVSHEQALPLAHLIDTLPALNLIGVMTHFATPPGEQSLLFEKCLARLPNLPPIIHSTLNAPYCTHLRLGLAPIKDALTLTTQIVHFSECPQGETVGYDASYTATRPLERIAILPIGYHDGIHRSYSNKAYVTLHGKKAPMVGRVCMDFMMIDVTDIPEARLGDTVTLFGNDALSAEAFAERGGTNIRELLVSLGPRIERYYTEKDEQKLRHPLRSFEKNTPSREHLVSP